VVEQIPLLVGFREIKILVAVVDGEAHFDGAVTIQSVDDPACL
jgi:hypothetical protein